jgi:hypothetical protein
LIQLVKLRAFDLSLKIIKIYVDGLALLFLLFRYINFCCLLVLALGLFSCPLTGERVSYKLLFIHRTDKGAWWFEGKDIGVGVIMKAMIQLSLVTK